MTTKKSIEFCHQIKIISHVKASRPVHAAAFAGSPLPRKEGQTTPHKYTALPRKEGGQIAGLIVLI